MNEFDQKALEWDKNQMHFERTVAVAALLQKKIPDTSNIKAMEFGAGTALLSFYFKDRFSEITLIDSSPEMLRMAEQKMEPTDKEKIKTVYLDLEKEDFNGGPFDIIYSQMVLHHITDINGILRKLFHLLSPGGVLAIADLYQEDGSFHDGAEGVLHGFDPDKLKEIVLQQGFHEYQVEPCFIIRKESSPGIITAYPVFLMTARRYGIKIISP